MEVECLLTVVAFISQLKDDRTGSASCASFTAGGHLARTENFLRSGAVH